jgi:hypothetical protein
MLVKGFVSYAEGVTEFNGVGKVLGDTIVITTDGIEVDEGDVVTMVLR